MDSFGFLRHMQEYLLKGEFSSSVDYNEQVKLKRASSNFILKGGRLFYIGPSRQYMRLVVLSEEEKRSVLTECHETGKHHGHRSTRDRVIAGYYWSTLIQDVKDWVKCCHLCRSKDPVKTAAPMLHSNKIKEAWEVLGLDLIGPLPETTRNNRYVLTLTDVYTKWLIAEPLQSETATEVSAIITSKLYVFGMVRKIIADQDKVVINELNAKIFNVLNIKPVVSSTSHLQTSGKDTRTKQAIKQALRKHVNDNLHDWDLKLPAVVYGINTAKQDSTRDSPYFLLFHRHPRLPEMLNACPVGDDSEVADPEEGIKVNEMKRLCELHMTVHQKAEADPAPLRSHNEANLFQCPFCSPEVYKPKEYQEIVTHLVSHKFNSIQHKGYVIYPCRLGCDGQTRHFHCCYCSQIFVNKSAALKHLDAHSTAPLVGPQTGPPPHPVGADHGVEYKCCTTISQSSVNQDHSYALLPSLDSLKEKLVRAEAQVEKLEQQFEKSNRKDLKKKLELYSALMETETLPSGELQDYLQCPPDRHPLLGLAFGCQTSTPIYNLTNIWVPTSVGVQLCPFK